TLGDIEIIDIFSRHKVTFLPRPNHTFPNETLIYHGYLGCSPVFPTVAISLRMLSAYRQAHRVCPRFSIHAQCKMLCHLHNVPYRPYLFTQLSIAYDIYLDVIHQIEQQIQISLQSEGQEWRLRNECPACFYRLDDEPPLTLDWLISIDGNNSLKHWDTTAYGTIPRDDSQVARSTYWLTKDDVDKFKHEVKSRATASNGDINAHDDDWETEPDDRTPTKFNCVDRWRNAKSDIRKKTYSVFQESGIFVATCRHRFVLLACDMIKSRELAKYPLAILNRLLDVYGPNGGCAYDIGCAFAAT
ncbi:hypothetical protein L210DRAFT_3320488, partial [Boletus edulis BED1]